MEEFSSVTVVCGTHVQSRFELPSCCDFFYPPDPADPPLPLALPGNPILVTPPPPTSDLHL